MFVNICPAEKEMFFFFYIFHTQMRSSLIVRIRTCLDRYSWSLTIALRISLTNISRLAAKIIKLVHELDEPEWYVARNLCIFTKEVGWNPDRTVMNENSIYNGTRMSKGVLVYKCFVNIGIIWGYQKVNRHLQEKESSSEQDSSWRNIKIK